MTFLTVDRVCAEYGATRVLNDVTAHVAEGEMHVLLGPSGCGKTTLLRAISGLQAISGGSIALAGRRIDALPPADRGLAMVFQHYALFPNMTVRQNLAFALGRRGLGRARIADNVDRMLEVVDLTPRADALPAALSGGQKQRVALARALVLEPRLLLLDEPLSALDAQIRKRLQLELKRMQRQLGLTAILVTHDQDEAMRMGDRISILNAGRIVQSDRAETVFHRPADTFVARFLGEANILPAHLIAPGRAGHAVIHPAAFEIVTDLPLLEAEVVDTEIMGQLVRIHCRAGGEALRVDRLAGYGAERPAPGDRLQLGARPDAVHFIAPTSSPSVPDNTSPDP
ncbi:ABC transporter ATP-binding protein [Falsirhodobacter sp. 20TX0035]|uniref:ABC transporter ATP-binding protein n=1 Tax=Falsirhodobacter sp. 20TX0035 TaxID=3022019 RepID=UPI00232E66FA|nr:ABC transporter ATP-binding protein [Falsirhodobacter sp. 20TX0035]MDB6453719.1 ABC transporter ATP-binding protein [Falsirhodobacter sp. 20TX0035]